VPAISGKRKKFSQAPRRRMHATYARTAGVRHLFAAYELGEDGLYGYVACYGTSTFASSAVTLTSSVRMAPASTGICLLIRGLILSRMSFNSLGVGF
jgi:hypothetical protein